MIPTLMPGAEPFFYPGGRVGCLCLHGMGASPDEVRWYGQHLAECGYTVYGPRLPGHGSRPADLTRMRWEDWYRAALDGYHLLQAKTDQVVVAGLSLGGLLTLMLAAHKPPAAAIVMAAPLHLPNARMLPYVRWLKYTRRYIDASDRTDFPTRLIAEQRRRGERPVGRVRYSRWASRAAQELYTLMGLVRETLPQVRVPVLALYSRADPTVPYLNLDLLCDGLGNAAVESVTLERSGHILTQDAERETVFHHSAAFIERLTG